MADSDPEAPSRCGCGRRLVYAPICVRCRREPSECKCSDLTKEDEQ